ncbi:very short patch repair endonuclease [bacterium]|nr:very short patch repair endonuclease [bacterium]
MNQFQRDGQLGDVVRNRSGSLDTLSPTERSERMGRVKHKDSKPEMRVRRIVHSLGYRYRLHRASLPGKPDLVFCRRRKVIFVHGCFWHRHLGCPRTRFPKSPERADFWREKLTGNEKRDAEIQLRLRNMGWDVLVIWECESEDAELVTRKVRQFLG